MYIFSQYSSGSVRKLTSEMGIKVQDSSVVQPVSQGKSILRQTQTWVSKAAEEGCVSQKTIYLDLSRMA